MAITAVFNAPEMTAEQYDTVVKELDNSGAGAPKGRLYHVASPDGAGWFVVDVWDSEDNLSAFAQSLIPAFQKIGIAPPQPQIRPVHNIIEG